MIIFNVVIDVFDDSDFDFVVKFEAIFVEILNKSDGNDGCVVELSIVNGSFTVEVFDFEYNVGIIENDDDLSCIFKVMSVNDDVSDDTKVSTDDIISRVWAVNDPNFIADVVL